MKRRACKRLLTAAVLCAALTVPAKAARRSVPVQKVRKIAVGFGPAVCTIE